MHEVSKVMGPEVMKKSDQIHFGIAWFGDPPPKEVVKPMVGHVGRRYLLGLFDQEYAAL